VVPTNFLNIQCKCYLLYVKTNHSMFIISKNNQIKSVINNIKLI
jgi:hypothetical protein